MKNLGKAAILSATLCLAGMIALPQTAHAYDGGWGWGGGGWGGGGGGGSCPVVSAPELDPSSALAALTLLSGALLVVRGRKAGKKK